MKGILLAGGRNTRLYPTTVAVNKHLLPIYNKPMIYYSLSLLMSAGVRDILVISNPESLPSFMKLLGGGYQWGVKFTYITQPHPNGIAEAFIVGEEFIGDSPVCLVLGDNMLYGYGLTGQLTKAAQLTHGATVFAYKVKDPERYGVVEFDTDGRVLSIEEKPSHPKSEYAIPGIYFYDNNVVHIARTLSPSGRGELEITDVNRAYMEQHELSVVVLGRGVAWLDAGTHESLLQAANFVQAVEERQGVVVASPEEMAYRKGYITLDELHNIASGLGCSDYGRYLLSIRV
jgi:glucose-1-phosphate thymidylyltransferase